MTTKRRLKEEINELEVSLIAAQMRANKARDEADKAEKRLKSMQIGAAIGEAIGEGWIQCKDFTISSFSDHYGPTYDYDSSFALKIAAPVVFSATIELAGDPNSLMRFGNVLMGK